MYRTLIRTGVDEFRPRTRVLWLEANRIRKTDCLFLCVRKGEQEKVSAITAWVGRTTGGEIRLSWPGSSSMTSTET